jgi:hypothetical protein
MTARVCSIYAQLRSLLQLILDRSAAAALLSIYLWGLATKGRSTYSDCCASHIFILEFCHTLLPVGGFRLQTTNA